MKHLIHIFSVILLVVLLTACTSSKGNENQTPTGAGAPADSSTGATEVYIDVTDAPTESAPSEDIKENASTDASSDKTHTGAESAESELVGNQWKLSKLYKDGEERQIYVEYGSVIRQTGAYIKFNEDDTFECILGIPGCKGTYAVENGDIALHITTKYGAKTEDCDEYATVKWDHEAGTLTFDFNNLTNVFTKNG